MQQIGIAQTLVLQNLLIGLLPYFRVYTGTGAVESRTIKSAGT